MYRTKIRQKGEPHGKSWLGNSQKCMYQQNVYCYEGIGGKGSQGTLYTLYKQVSWHWRADFETYYLKVQ